jgi:hypothetical protein
MTPCPNCSGDGRVIESRTLKAGGRRRRYRCDSCGFAWTIWTDDPGPIEHRGFCAGVTRLSDEAIADILTSDEPRQVLAERHGRAISTIEKVQYGQLHARVLPELRRFNARP